ncbi:DUF6090 family protein [Mangrovimonas sp. AS39]|uniref:DUF6090 family protein n=1 Tax=Mangrovimonas futianensis TaxID=2895523 RepID=UPI001E5F3B4C|nr:DUF6090 family protein [Mangrovimonas futianensis]MCF1193124.1 DUF6090 family protein [Mangrovimonas futianensis]MCF1196814.1 DUF6090 family protein [Mangrovimonas futianensis]
MIKFFRKIRQNLLSEGKTGKYLKYAIGEIILVVIGILIALQINNWNEDKKERKEENQALVSLHDEFIQSRELFVSNQRHSKKVFDGMQNLLEILDSKRINEKSIDSIYHYLNTSSWSSSTFNPSRGIVNSLVNSGKLNIISNDKLKSQLIQWNDQVIGFQNLQKLAQDYKFTYLFPLISEITKLPSKIKRDLNKNYDINDVGQKEVDFTLLQSKMFYNYLNQCWVYSGAILADNSQTNSGKKIQIALDNIIFLIEEELGE